MATALPIAWHDGRQQPLETVRISPLDRGFLFGDGIYEVIPVYAGTPLALDRHLARLERSAAAIRLAMPTDAETLAARITALIDANGGGDLSVYVQASRSGDAGRDHRFPGCQETNLFMMCSPLTPVVAEHYRGGVPAITRADERWARCDIKATSLLANVLAKQAAEESGAVEAVLVRDGRLIEGSTSAVGCVIDGALVLPPEDHQLLPSITRSLVVECAGRSGVAVEVRPVRIGECRAADEILLMSSTKEVAPVGTLDGEAVGRDGQWPVWSTLFSAYQALKAAT